MLKTQKNRQHLVSYFLNKLVIKAIMKQQNDHQCKQQNNYHDKGLERISITAIAKLTFRINESRKIHKHSSSF
jgi:hypothetical protein